MTMKMYGPGYHDPGTMSYSTAHRMSRDECMTDRDKIRQDGVRNDFQEKEYARAARYAEVRRLSDAKRTLQW